jgi:hypothetical protein
MARDVEAEGELERGWIGVEGDLDPVGRVLALGDRAPGVLSRELGTPAARRALS